MFVRWVFIVLLYTQANFKCVPNRIKIWSPVKCEAGRRFFAKLGGIPEFPTEISQPYLYPWLAEIKISNLGRIRFCSGALINDKYVLTSQSCVSAPIQANQINVHLGFYNGYKQDVSEIFQPRVFQSGVSEIIRHFYYDPNNIKTAENNLALLKLKKDVKYSKTIYPIQLPAPADKFNKLANTFGENVEWSFFSLNNKKIKDVETKILDLEQCRRFNSNYQRIGTGVICGVGDNRSKPCGAEMGGLLSVTKPKKMYNVTVLIGITAWDPPCQSHLPRVYVRLDNKLDWIRENTRDGAYCRY